MRTRRSLWRHADFMRLWTAESVSRLGSQVSLLALPLAAITVLHASTFEVGLLSTVEFAPFVLVGLPAGVWVDRLRRRPVLTTGNLGWLAGAMLAGRLGNWLGIGRVIVGAIGLGGLGTLLIPLAPEAAPIPVLIAAQFLQSFGGTAYNISQLSLRQAITPARLHGRMNATMRFMVWGTLPVGAAIGGALGGAIGLRPTVWIAAVASLLPVLPALRSSVWPLRSVEAVLARYAHAG